VVIGPCIVPSDRRNPVRWTIALSGAMEQRVGSIPIRFSTGLSDPGNARSRVGVIRIA